MSPVRDASWGPFAAPGGRLCLRPWPTATRPRAPGGAPRWGKMEFCASQDTPILAKRSQILPKGLVIAEYCKTAPSSGALRLRDDQQDERAGSARTDNKITVQLTCN